ncbi:MAG: tetratricopeptide repeat protein [Pseudomonadota bacterium]
MQALCDKGSIDIRAMCPSTRLKRACVGVAISILAAAPAVLYAQSGEAEWKAQNEALTLRFKAEQLDAQTIEMVRQLIQIAERTYGPQSRVVAQGQYQLGFTHWRRGEHLLAEAAFASAVAIQEKLPARPGDPMLAYYIENLATAFVGQRAWTKAAAQWERALALYEKDAGPDSRKLLMPLRELANVYHLQGDSPKAELTLLRALDIADASGSHHAIDAIAGNLHILGKHYLNRGDAARALPVLEREVTLLLGSGRATPEALGAARQLRDQARRQALVRIDEKRKNGPGKPASRAGQAQLEPAPADLQGLSGQFTGNDQPR